MAASNPADVPDPLVVTDGALIGDVFRSASFEVVAYADHYRAISKRTGLDFEATINALDAVPLANEGEAHRNSRIRAATAIATDRRGHAETMDQFIADLVSRTFTSGAEVELRTDVALPIFTHVYALWTGITLEQELNVSQMFCGRMSLNRRVEINTSIQALNEIFNGDIRVAADVAATFGILGSDALIGSLALSLWEEISRHQDVPLSEIAFPDSMPSSGVPYIDRVATEDTTVGDQAVVKGQRVRLMLEATTLHASGQEQDLLFGKGRHLCLGKPMSQGLWRSLAKALGGITLRATPVAMKMRPRDYVFSYPEFARVKLHD
jgi:hypothetical protein